MDFKNRLVSLLLDYAEYDLLVSVIYLYQIASAMCDAAELALGAGSVATLLHSNKNSAVDRQKYILQARCLASPPRRTKTTRTPDSPDVFSLSPAIGLPAFLSGFPRIGPRSYASSPVAGVWMTPFWWMALTYGCSLADEWGCRTDAALVIDGADVRAPSCWWMGPLGWRRHTMFFCSMTLINVNFIEQRVETQPLQTQLFLWLDGALHTFLP